MHEGHRLEKLSCKGLGLWRNPRGSARDMGSEALKEAGRQAGGRQFCGQAGARCAESAHGQEPRVGRGTACHILPTADSGQPEVARAEQHISKAQGRRAGGRAGGRSPWQAGRACNRCGAESRRARVPAAQTPCTRDRCSREGASLAHRSAWQRRSTGTPWQRCLLYAKLAVRRTAKHKVRWPSPRIPNPGSQQQFLHSERCTQHMPSR